MMLQDEVAVHPGTNSGFTDTLDDEAEVLARGVDDQNVLATHCDLATTSQASKSTSNAIFNVPTPVVVEILNGQLKRIQTLRTVCPSGNGSEFGSLVDFQPTMGPADVAKVDGLTDTSTKTKYQVYVLSAEAKYYKLVVS